MIGEFFNHFFTHYGDYEYGIAASQLFLAMLGMGALLAPSDFVAEVRQPRAMLLGFACQWALVPLIALALGWVLPVPAGIAVGLILIAAVPGGTLTNILTLFGRGNIALSVALTGITTVAALAVTPILLKLLAAPYLPADFHMPAGRVAQDIFLTLIVPLAIGMLLKTRLSTWYAAQFSKWVIRASLLLILVIVVGAAGSGRLDAGAYGVSGVLALLCFCAVIQFVGWLVCRAARLVRRDTLAIVIELSYRNISLALAVKAIVFPARDGVPDPIGDAVIFTALLYGGVSLFMALVPVVLNRRWTAPGVAPQHAAGPARPSAQTEQP